MFKKLTAKSNESVVLDYIVKADPPSTIRGWVNNSLVVLAVSCTDLIAVILLLVTVTLVLQLLNQYSRCNKY